MGVEHGLTMKSGDLASQYQWLNGFFLGFDMGYISPT